MGKWNQEERENAKSLVADGSERINLRGREMIFIQIVLEIQSSLSEAAVPFDSSRLTQAESMWDNMCKENAKMRNVLFG